MWFPYSFLPSSCDFQRDCVVTLIIADSRFKNEVNTCAVRLFCLQVQFSVIVDFYFMNFTWGFLVWLTTMVSIILTIADNIKMKWVEDFTFTGTLGTRYTLILFAFFVFRAILSPLDFRWIGSILKEANCVRPSRSANILYPCNNLTLFFQVLSHAIGLPVSRNVT